MTEVETTNSGSTKVVPTPTTVLPKTLNNTLLQVYKCRTTGEPSFMFKRLFPNTVQQEGNLGPLRSLTHENITVNFNLSLSRGSFFYRAARLYNALPPDIKRCPTVPTFKKLLRKWVRHNISLVP